MTTTTTYSIGAPRKKKSLTLYLTRKEKRKILVEHGLAALHLLEFYLSVIVRDGYIIDDKKTADSTGLSLRSVGDNRRLLIQNNLFYIIKTTDNRTNNTIYLYCALKEGVCIKKYFDLLFSCKSISEVYKKHTRITFNDILLNSKLTAMEIKDIKDLLNDFHTKVMNTKRHNPNW